MTSEAMSNISMRTDIWKHSTAGVRLNLVKKEAIVEYVARAALVRIISQDALWPHFGNTVALKKFWALSRDERQNIWGDPIDPMVPVADFDPNYLHDGRLGKT